VVSAFPAEIQSGVAAQLSDCLLAVISQRLRFRSDLNIRVPECEILMVTHAVRNFIRNRDFFKIVSSLETGAEHGMWTFQRYRTWLDNRTNWTIPGQSPEPPDTESSDTPATAPPSLPAFPVAPKPAGPLKRPGASPSVPAPKSPGRIEIEPVEGEFGKILKRPGEKS
jgi:twitching motility protein PilT